METKLARENPVRPSLITLPPRHEVRQKLPAATKGGSVLIPKDWDCQIEFPVILLERHSFERGFIFFPAATHICPCVF